MSATRQLVSGICATKSVPKPGAPSPLRCVMMRSGAAAGGSLRALVSQPLDAPHRDHASPEIRSSPHHQVEKAALIILPPLERNRRHPQPRQGYVPRNTLRQTSGEKLSALPENWLVFQLQPVTRTLSAVRPRILVDHMGSRQATQSQR